MTRSPISARRALVIGLVAASAAAFGFFVLPQIADLGHTWRRVSHGEAHWLLLAVAFEVLSFAGYVALFRAVFVRQDSRIDWRESYEITMAGLAATRLFAAAGAGGVALTAWALKRSGMDAHTVARRMTAFLVLLYGVYMSALVIAGLGLFTGVLPGSAPLALTLIPAAFGALVIVGVAGLARVRPRLRLATAGERRLLERAGAFGASISGGVRTAIALVRTRDAGLLGAPAWWGFDIAVLWAAFHAFGAPPPTAVLVLGYFVGMLANTLPLPGGVGGVDGGMIGAFIAFGVDPGLALLAVLSYRAIAFWLPTVPGALAYLRLRRTVGNWQEQVEQPAAAPAPPPATEPALPLARPSVA